MWRLWPSKKQYLSWSMPSKLTFISAYIGIITLIVSSFTSFFSYLNLAKTDDIISFEIQVPDLDYKGKIFMNENGHSKVVYENDYARLGFVKDGDFNLDGFKDLLFYEDGGGNCCPLQYVILSSHGDGYVKLYKNEDFWTWSEPESIFVNNRWLFRVTQSSLGVGNTSAEEARVTFEIVDDELIEVERLGQESRPMIRTIQEISSTYYSNNPKLITDAITMSYDLNQNGVEDIISCHYWERWGSLQCESIIDEVKFNISYGCQRLGISYQMHEGYHSLVCNRDTLLNFNPNSKSYE